MNDKETYEAIELRIFEERMKLYLSKIKENEDEKIKEKKSNCTKSITQKMPLSPKK